MNFVVFYERMMSIYLGSECTLHDGVFSDLDSVKRAINLVIDVLKDGYDRSKNYVSFKGKPSERIRISYLTGGQVLISDNIESTWIYLNEKDYKGDKNDASEYIDKLKTILNELCT